MHIQGIDTAQQAFTAQELRLMRWHYYRLKGTLMLAKKTLLAIDAHPMTTNESKRMAAEVWRALSSLDEAMETRVHLPLAKEY